MDFNIDTIAAAQGLGAMTFGRSDDILNNIFLSLMVKKGSFFARPSFGSRLHELARNKNNAANEALAKDYCAEALQWLIDTGKAVSFDIQTERDPAGDHHRLKIQITAVQADLSIVTFETYQEVI